MSGANIALPMIGSYTNTMLYTLELVLAYVYFFASPRCSKDPVFLKCCVATSLVSDTVGTIGVCALIFVTVLIPTDDVTVGKLYWGFQMYIVSNTINAFIFQSYMVHRYWTLSRNYVVSSFIALLVLTSLGTCIALLKNNFSIVAEELFQKNKIHIHLRLILLVLITAMLADISITIALLWQLNRPGAYGRLSMQTKRLIARISSQAIKTGVVPCVFALITLVTYVSYRNQNIASCFAFMLGRVYTSTMLFSLIYRDKLGPDSNWVASMTELESASSMSFARPSVSTPALPTVPPLAVDKGHVQSSIGGSRKHDSMFLQDKSSGFTTFDLYTLDISNEGRPPSHISSDRKSPSLAEPGVSEP